MKFNEIINSETPTLVDFTATWCGPCQMMAPILQHVAGKVEGKVRILKVDIDKNPAAARQYRVQSVPTLILFKKGEMVWRQSGVLPENQLTAVLLQHASR